MPTPTPANPTPMNPTPMNPLDSLRTHTTERVYRITVEDVFSGRRFVEIIPAETAAAALRKILHNGIDI